MAGIEDLLGSVLGGASGGGDATKLVQPLIEMVTKEGGLGALLGQLQNSPIADQVGSWIGTGDNKAVTGDALASSLGEANIEGLTQSSGLSADQVKNGLTEMLPNLIDKLSPGGAIPGADQIGEVLKGIPGGDQLQGQLGSILGGLLGGGK